MDISTVKAFALVVNTLTDALMNLQNRVDELERINADLMKELEKAYSVDR